MIETITAVGLICIAMSAVYLLKHRRSEPSNDKYLWVGHGKDPFEK